jgi:hypothetical protein
MTMVSAVMKPPFPVETRVRERIERALGSHRPSNGRASDDLCPAVVAATVALRELGMTPEAALLTIKALVYDAGQVEGTPPLASYLIVSDPLMTEVVRWCVKAYFGELTES